jgi:CheY-like chemotaxis protein
MDVLYVEDNPANLRLMVELLGLRPGVRLHTAGDADRGLALAQDLRPALMLLDIQLPGTDGFELLRQLRATGVAAPAVAVTANAMPADVARGLAAGFEHYLTKPLDLRRVLAIVDEALAAQAGGAAAG